MHHKGIEMTCCETVAMEAHFTTRADLYTSRIKRIKAMPEVKVWKSRELVRIMGRMVKTDLSTHLCVAH